MNKQTIYDIDVAGKRYMSVWIIMFPVTRMGISPMTEESVLHSRPSDIY